MPDVAIRMDGLGKRYRIGTPRHYRALRDVAAGALDRALGRSAPRPEPSEPEWFWALRDLTCTVTRGEALGVIGVNGAGKSTLLKVLARITAPTEGRAMIAGRVGSLLEVGTGFHPELTGRENIFLNGAILGMRKQDIERKFDAMVDFSGVERFIDTPVKHYSSGMYVRLAFSVAAHLEPDILLVDEVLAVGDAAFQQKCLGKMDEIGRSGRTILFISHNMAAIRRLCTRALLLTQGRIAKDGVPEEVIRAYLAGVERPEAEGEALAARTDRSGHGRVRVTELTVDTAGAQDGHLRTGRDGVLTIRYAAAKGVARLPFLHVNCTVFDVHGTPLFSCTTSQRDFTRLAPEGRLICRISQVPLIPGRYTLNILLKDEQGFADRISRALVFTVVDDGGVPMPYLPSTQWGSTIVPHAWEAGPEPMPEAGTPQAIETRAA